jgi:dTDP-4-amino-4,6-dideoxygalactose transaminase
VKGFNSRLDELQAAMLRVKLAKLDEWNKCRKGVADYYRETLKEVDGLALPDPPDGLEPVEHLFVIRYPDRGGLQEHLSAAGIGTLIHYPVPPHLQESYAELGYKAGRFPIAERLAREVLSIPMGPHISMEQAAYVASQILSFVKRQEVGAHV